MDTGTKGEESRPVDSLKISFFPLPSKHFFNTSSSVASTFSDNCISLLSIALRSTLGCLLRPSFSCSSTLRFGRSGVSEALPSPSLSIAPQCEADAGGRRARAHGGGGRVAPAPAGSTRGKVSDAIRMQFQYASHAIPIQCQDHSMNNAVRKHLHRGKRTLNSFIKATEATEAT